MQPREREFRIAELQGADGMWRFLSKMGRKTVSRESKLSIGG